MAARVAVAALFFYIHVLLAALQVKVPALFLLIQYCGLFDVIPMWKLLPTPVDKLNLLLDICLRILHTLCGCLNKTFPWVYTYCVYTYSVFSFREGKHFFHLMVLTYTEINHKVTPFKYTNTLSSS